MEGEAQQTLLVAGTVDARLDVEEGSAQQDGRVAREVEDVNHPALLDDEEAIDIAGGMRRQ